MADPLFAEALNPRLALQRRMQAEGQVPPTIPDVRPSPPPVRMGRPFTPEERAKQQALLVQLLRARDAGQPAPAP